MSDGRFRFETTPHGLGGFAKVLKGHDDYLDRDVAVKVLDPLVTKFPETDRERFRREARVLAKLSHPNIPAIYDVSFTDESFLIIFEFIEGKSLAQYLTEQGTCNLSQARRWFAQIASALQHAHDNGVVHRDIKPTNIVLRSDLQTAYLVDFGIALTPQDGLRITKEGYFIGTPGYMSPEQESGQVVDLRTDIYSLGVTLYEALCGHRVAAGEYNPISQMNEAVPAGVDELIQDCLAPRDQRVCSATAFAARLDGVFGLQRPLSEVLAKGRLNELALALNEYSAETFIALPAGQRALILTKIDSIINSDDPNLDYPGADLLELMIVRGLLLPKEEFRSMAAAAVYWAFDKVYPMGRQGRPSLQDRLSESCLTARGDALQVIREELEAFLCTVQLDDKPDWYLHNLREIISCLMANPTLTADPACLNGHLRDVNRIQRTHTS